MPSYDPSVYQAAAKIYVHSDMTLQEISDMEGMPGYVMLSKAKSSGKGNDGEDWAETRESLVKAERAVSRKAALDAQKQDLEQVVDGAKHAIAESIVELRTQLENEGASNPSYKQLIDLYDKLMEYEGRDHLQVVFEIMYDIVDDVGEVLAYHLQDQNKLRNIMADLQDRMTEYERRLDPILDGERE